jgi:hypothetical protein
MIRDACDDELIAKDPYLALRRRNWPEDPGTQGRDRFTAAERDRVIGWFDEKVYRCPLPLPPEPVVPRPRHLPLLDGGAAV